MSNNDSQIKELHNKYDMQKIILIQTCFRGYLARKEILIPSSYYQTKTWRKNMKWYKNGKSNECEKYQIDLIERIIALKLNKTQERINTETTAIVSKKNPMISDDGYEWTENFDGRITKKDNICYFNLKFVCDSGGAQTRTLREVYHFINYQLKNLVKFNTTNIYFINILDGDNCYNNINKFKYLISKEKYKNICKYVFLGCLYEFQKNNIIKNL